MPIRIAFRFAIVLAQCAVLSAGAVIAGAGQAAAADISMFVKAQPKPVVTPWEGFYIGAHAGYGWGHKQWIDNFPVFDGEIDADVNVAGALGGLQFGYNHQLNWLVIGAEGDFTWSGVGNNDFQCFDFGDQVCTNRPEWFADIAGRIGVTYGPALYYAKGGAAWVQDHFTNLATCAGSQPTTKGGITASCGDEFFADQLRFGWLIGGGWERYFADNWSVKIEYNYMDFGSRSVSFTDGNGDLFTEEIRQKAQEVKVGINYHFGGPAPAVAPAAWPAIYKAKPQGENGSNRTIAFSGFDASKYNYSGWAGTFIAPYGTLSTSGMRLMISGEGGAYKYPAEDILISGTTASGDLLVGYGFEGETTSFNLLVGPNAINHTLSTVDLENPVQGTALGAKVRADLRVEPTSSTMAYGESEYSTAFGTYYSTAKLGYELVRNSRTYLGPEAAVLGDERSNQWRVGGHISALKIGTLEFDISCGYAQDSSVGASAYGHIEISKTF